MNNMLRKTFSSLPPEEAGSFSEFTKKETSVRKSMWSGKAPTNTERTSEVEYEMSEEQRLSLRYMQNSKAASTSNLATSEAEKKRLEQEKLWEEAEKAEERRVEVEDKVRRLTIESMNQKQAEVLSRNYEANVKHSVIATEGNMLDKYEYQMNSDSNGTTMNELEELYKATETNECDFERIMELKKKHGEQMSLHESKHATAEFGDDLSKALVLGVGAFGRVIKARLKKSQNNLVAIKEIVKANLTPSDLRSLKNEILILKQCSHENLLNFHEFYETDVKYSIVSDLLEGGELYDFIHEKADKNNGNASLTEKQVSTLMTSLFKALDYLQDFNVAHRDIKPENILFRKKTSIDSDDLSGIVLVDFGFAAHCQGASFSNICGTADFIAPEILKGLNYDFRCDVWSCGVLAYLLLRGVYPFLGDSDFIKHKAIKSFKGFSADSTAPESDANGNDLPSLDVDRGFIGISLPARTLISNCLKIIPQKRPLPRDVLLTFNWLEDGSKYIKAKDEKKEMQLKQEEEMKLQNEEIERIRIEELLKQAQVKPEVQPEVQVEVQPEIEPEVQVEEAQVEVQNTEIEENIKKQDKGEEDEDDDDDEDDVVEAVVITKAKDRETEGPFVAKISKTNEEEEEEGEEEEEEAVEVISELNISNVLATPTKEKTRPGTTVSGKLPRQCSDIGVGEGSLFHVPQHSRPGMQHAASTGNIGGGNGGLMPSLSFGVSTYSDQSSTNNASSGGWWVGILGPHSAYICPLTKKPFVDPVISLVDGITYEREAIAKRNLSKLATDRQKTAWAEARSSAVDDLVNDKYVLTMPQKLSRLVALKNNGFFGKTTGSTSGLASALFDEAKGKLLSSRCAAMTTHPETPQEVHAYATALLKQATDHAKLTKEERIAFLGQHDGTGHGEESEEEEEESVTVNDDHYDVNKVPVRRVRRPSVVKQDVNAGMIANDAMRVAVLELKKMLIGGPVAEAHARARREEENSKLKSELANVQAKRQLKKQKDQAKAMHSQLKSMSLHEMIGGATRGRTISTAVNHVVSPLGMVGDEVGDDEVITSVEVTVDKSDEEKVIYRTFIRNKAGSSGSCAHRFAAYRTLFEKLEDMGGAAFYFGGHVQFEQVQACFPSRDFTRRKMGINLTEEQLEERRKGIANWLNKLLIPQEAHIEGGNKVLALPIKTLVWNCLKLDARVTHL